MLNTLSSEKIVIMSKKKSKNYDFRIKIWKAKLIL